MPLVLPDAFDDAELPNGSEDYLWLVEVTLQKSNRTGTDPAAFTPPLVLRVCNNYEPIVWPVSNPLTQNWSPYSFAISPIESSSEGDLPVLQLQIDNTGRDLMATLHDGVTLEGNPVSLYLVPRNALTIAYPNHEFQWWAFQVSNVQADSERVTLRLERINFFAKTVPQDRFIARRCRWQFGSTQCGYIINSNAAFTTCEKTVAACTERGLDHLSRGLPRIHPERYGGFPGIPKQQ
jgi:hypothetical protein